MRKFLLILVVILANCSSSPVSKESKYPDKVKKIKLNPDRLVALNLTLSDDFVNAFDEQDCLSDDGELLKNPKTRMFLGWGLKWLKGSDFIMPLDGKYYIYSILLFDGAGTQDIKLGIAGKNYKDEVYEVEDDGGKYNQLKEFPVKKKGRYLTLSFGPGYQGPTEIFLMGYPIEKDKHEEKPVPLTTFDDFIGVNSFVWNKDHGKIKWIREYHESYRTDPKPYPNNEMVFTNQQGGTFDYDEFYKKNFEKGVTVCPTFHVQPPWMNDYPDSVQYFETVIPAKFKNLGKLQDPKSYKEMVFRLRETAKRYGSVKYPEDELKVMRGNYKGYGGPSWKQRVFSGAGWLKYYEVGNELNKWWKGFYGYMKPMDFAVLMDTCYKGLLDVDPNANLVIGGLAGINISYLEAMRLKLLEINHGQLPGANFILNVHHYCNAGGKQRSGKHAVSPEDDHLFDRLRKLVEYVQKFWNGNPIHLSEIGYDTNKSDQSVPEIGEKNKWEVQRDWLMRTLYISAMSGITRTQIFMYNDLNAPEDGVKRFAKSGIVTHHTYPKGQIDKPSKYGIELMIQYHEGMKPEGFIESGNENVMIASFTGGNKKSYALWCPTSKGLEVTYNFKVNSKVKVIEITGDYDDKVTEMEPVNGAISVKVTETPIIVVET